MSNQWSGERISLDNNTQIEQVQVHLSRYIWAMKFCTHKSVLDVGCGTGYGSFLLSRIAADVIGIDNSVEALAEAKRDYHGIFLQMEMEKAKLSWTFDTVLAFELIEHLDDMDVGLEKLKEFAKPDGTILISLPIHQGDNSYHHFRDYSCLDWFDLLENHFPTGQSYDGYWSWLCKYQPIEDINTSNVQIVPLVNPPDIEDGILLVAIHHEEFNEE